jgi:hypothetical protein
MISIYQDIEKALASYQGIASAMPKVRNQMPLLGAGHRKSRSVSASKGAFYSVLLARRVLIRTVLAPMSSALALPEATYPMPLIVLAD